MSIRDKVNHRSEARLHGGGGRRGGGRRRETRRAVGFVRGPWWRVMVWLLQFTLFFWYGAVWIKNLFAWKTETLPPANGNDLHPLPSVKLTQRQDPIFDWAQDQHSHNAQEKKNRQDFVDPFEQKVISLKVNALKQEEKGLPEELFVDQASSLRAKLPPSNDYK